MIERNSSYTEEGLGRLLEQFKGKPRISALLSAYLSECQSVEDALYDVLEQRLLQNDTASGDMLDKIGSIVGQPRNGQTDDQYLPFIVARIATNRSNGTAIQLAKIANLITKSTGFYITDVNPGSTVFIFGVGPLANVILYPTDAISVPQYDAMVRFLSQAIAAGVSLVAMWSPSGVDETLIFGSVSGLTPTSTQSPGSVQTIGVGGGVAAGIQLPTINKV